MEKGQTLHMAPFAPGVCEKCGALLITDTEVEWAECNKCADAAFERSREQAEWDYYHPAEIEE